MDREWTRPTDQRRVEASRGGRAWAKEHQLAGQRLPFLNHGKKSKGTSSSSSFRSNQNPCFEMWVTSATVRPAKEAIKSGVSDGQLLAHPGVYQNDRSHLSLLASSTTKPLFPNSGLALTLMSENSGGCRPSSQLLTRSNASQMIHLKLTLLMLAINVSLFRTKVTLWRALVMATYILAADAWTWL